jgi:hypothetical protein
MLLIGLAACSGGDPVPTPAETAPLGMDLTADGRIRAGAAMVDLTPVIAETWTDTNGDFTWSNEPFDDIDGDGVFDAVWIGGFGPLRPANGVHDPIWARAVVLSVGGDYIAFVSLDLVGLGSPRIHAARDRLVADGFDGTRLVVASSHNHQGPDTMGLWGNPLLGITGRDEAYQQRVTDAIESAVREAAAAMVPVDVTIGRVHTADLSPWYNGADWGGKNPVAKTHGMVYDGRDPVVVSDQLLVLQGAGDDGAVLFTLTNWSGHPEVRGSDNNLISADWIGAMRPAIEAHYGGMALHVPECLGGMQSALHADLPLVLEDGTHVFQVCDAVAVADPADTECFGEEVGSPRIDADGDPVPEWAEQDSWEFVTAHGQLLAEAAIAALDAGEPFAPAGVRVEVEPLYVPVENVAYQILGPQGMFDLDFDDAVTDPALCPEAAEPGMGCLETQTSRVEIGPLTWLAVPGEMLPELAWGFPEDDPRWGPEAAATTARGESRGAVFFPQHDLDCDETDYTACQAALAVGDCDCLVDHVAPYRISDDPTLSPILTPVDTEYRAVIGMADNYLSYIIPEPDFNHAVSLFTDDGDHYEDTVSPAHNFGTRVLEAQARIDARW